MLTSGYGPFQISARSRFQGVGSSVAVGVVPAAVHAAGLVDAVQQQAGEAFAMELLGEQGEDGEGSVGVVEAMAGAEQGIPPCPIGRQVEVQHAGIGVVRPGGVPGLPVHGGAQPGGNGAAFAPGPVMRLQVRETPAGERVRRGAGKIPAGHVGAVIDLPVAQPGSVRKQLAQRDLLAMAAAADVVQRAHDVRRQQAGVDQLRVDPGAAQQALLRGLEDQRRRHRLHHARDVELGVDAHRLVRIRTHPPRRGSGLQAQHGVLHDNDGVVDRLIAGGQQGGDEAIEQGAADVGFEAVKRL